MIFLQNRTTMSNVNDNFNVNTISGFKLKSTSEIVLPSKTQICKCTGDQKQAFF